MEELIINWSNQKELCNTIDYFKLRYTTSSPKGLLFYFFCHRYLPQGMIKVSNSRAYDKISDLLNDYCPSRIYVLINFWCQNISNIYTVDFSKCWLFPSLLELYFILNPYFAILRWIVQGSFFKKWHLSRVLNEVREQAMKTSRVP